MTPSTGPFGFGKFKQYKDYLPYFKRFDNPGKSYFKFDIYDLQGDGFIFVVLCLFGKALAVEVPFPGEKIKIRIDYRFPK